MTAAPQSLADLDWTAEGHRPAGQPGHVNIGRTTRRDACRVDYHTGLTYPAVLTATGVVVLWRDSGWHPMSPALAETFTPGPDWQARCTHLHALPTWTCLTEAQCDALAREEEQ
jgi:hypothetical protein